MLGGEHRAFGGEGYNAAYGLASGAEAPLATAQVRNCAVTVQCELACRLVRVWETEAQTG